MFSMRPPAIAMVFPYWRRRCRGSCSLVETWCGRSSQQLHTQSVLRCLPYITLTEATSRFTRGWICSSLATSASQVLGGACVQFPIFRCIQKDSDFWQPLHRSVRLSLECSQLAIGCHRCDFTHFIMLSLRNLPLRRLPYSSCVQPAGFWAFKGFVLGGLSFNELSQIEPRKIKPAKGGRERRG